MNITTLLTTPLVENGTMINTTSITTPLVEIKSTINNSTNNTTLITNPLVEIKSMSDNSTNNATSITTPLVEITSNVADGFMEWAVRVLKIDSKSLAIFVVILICLASLILIIIVVYCFCSYFCKKQRDKGPQMTKVATLYKDQLPRLDANSKEKGCGSLEYSLEYNMKAHELKVKVIQCSDLVTPLGSGTTDPYVKVTLTTKGPPNSKPSKLKPRIYTTATKMDTMNPCFNESISFKLAYEDLKNTSIRMVVYDYDEIAQHLVIGGYTVDLETVLLENYVGKNYETTVDLTPVVGGQDESGQLCVVLTNMSSDNELHVNVLEAKNLNLPFIHGSSYPDTFVSVTLHIGNKKLGNKKTQTRKNTSNPYFGETLIFSVNKQKLPLSDLTLKIKFKNAAGIFRTYATVNIGCTAVSPSEQKQWREILSNPKRPVGMWQAVNENSDE